MPPHTILAMSTRRAVSAVLLLALAGPVSASPAFSPSGLQGDTTLLHSRAYYEENFRSWMAEYGASLGTKGEFEHRLRTFAENR